jgi:mono/diheme cytochrome c family protein
MRLWKVLIAVLIVAIGAIAIVRRAAVGGFSTRAEPTVVERMLARFARRTAVPRAAREAKNPIPFTPQAWADSRAHFADHCATCHGNDGAGNTEIGQGLYPKAPDMRLDATQQLTDGELYWIIENGVRLTGMPAWGNGKSDDEDTWKLVHFIRHLKDLTPEHLDEMKALNPKTPAELKEEEEDRRFLEGGDVPPPDEPDHSHHHPQ